MVTLLAISVGRHGAIKLRAQRRNMITNPPELGEGVDLHTCNVCIEAYAAAYRAARLSLQESAERQLRIMRRLEESAPESAEYLRACRAYYAIDKMVEPMIIRGRVD